MKKIAIFASGSGTNAENIYKFFSNGNRVSVPLVVYDRAAAGVRERMAKYPDVKTLYMPGSVWKEHPEEVLDLLENEDIDLVVLAGFLRFVPDLLTERYAGRMLNIHPSLLPAYGGPGMYGDKVHEAVIAAGEKRSGVTVHYVSDKMDEGEILMQEEVEVTPDDTPAALASKIHAVEYSLYPRAIVAALSRLDEAGTECRPDGNDTESDAGAPEVATPEADRLSASEDVNPPSIKGVTPPPVPSPAEEWAETLGMTYDPEKVTQLEEDTQQAAYPQMDAAGIYGTNDRSYPGWRPDPSAHFNQAPGDEARKMPPTNLVWAVLSTILCCLPLGIVAIIFSSQVSNKFYAGDIEGAWKASRNAEIWIIISFVVGVMVNTLYLPLMMLF